MFTRTKWLKRKIQRWYKIKKEDPDEIDTITVSTRGYSVSELSAKQKEYAKDIVKSTPGILELGHFINLGDNGTVKIIDMEPERGIITQKTEVNFKDRIFYKEGDEEFDVDEDRLYRVENFDSLERDLEISDAKSFANVLTNNLDSEVYVTDNGNRWMCEGKVFDFSRESEN